MNAMRNLTRAGILAGAAALAVAATAITPAAHADTIVLKEPARHLHGFQSEWIPQTQCPADHPYLLNQSFAPFGITLIKGIEISEGTAHPWPIVPWVGSGAFDRDGYAVGIGTGSATNWSVEDAWYAVRVHCTNDSSQGWTIP